GNELEHAPSGRPYCHGNLSQFFLAGGEGRRVLAVARAVIDRARGREAEGAGLQRFSDQPRHLPPVLGRRGFAVRPAFSHDVDPQRRMADLSGDIQVVVPLCQRIHVVGEGLPVPGEPFGQDHFGNVLDPFHQADQSIVVGGAAGSEPDAAIAHDDAGYAQARRWVEPVGPGSLAVVMRMDVNEAGCGEQTPRIDLFSARAGERSHGGYPAPNEADVALIRLPAGTVGYRSAAHDQVEIASHRFLRSLSCCPDMIRMAVLLVNPPQFTREHSLRAVRALPCLLKGDAWSSK